MKSSALGKSISKGISRAEVQDVSRFGLWLYVNKKEYFLPYDKYPWFKDAKVSEIYNLQFLHGYHLRWPDLDVDLELDSLDHPEKYPLTFLEKPGRRWGKAQSSQLLKKINLRSRQKPKGKST
jgi:hypothetical protein